MRDCGSKRFSLAVDCALLSLLFLQNGCSDLFRSITDKKCNCRQALVTLPFYFDGKEAIIKLFDVRLRIQKTFRARLPKLVNVLLI